MYNEETFSILLMQFLQAQAGSPHLGGRGVQVEAVRSRKMPVLVTSSQQKTLRSPSQSSRCPSKDNSVVGKSYQLEIADKPSVCWLLKL